jgi:uncharacterized small protein (DUF1192 family)
MDNSVSRNELIQALLAERDVYLAEHDRFLRKRKRQTPPEIMRKLPIYGVALVAERDTALVAERDTALAERDTALAERDAALADLEKMKLTMNSMALQNSVEYQKMKARLDCFENLFDGFDKRLAVFKATVRPIS